MTTIAVTGGIGAGKSTVCRMLAGFGAVVIDSDQLARQVVAPGTEGRAAVVEEFGEAMLLGDDSLNRAALAAIVFADAGARARLEAITHPLIRAEFARLRDAALAADPRAVVVNDIPLVRTEADAAAFDLVVTVVAEEQVRVDRLVERGLTEADARARIGVQISDAERARLADLVITNHGDEHELRAQVEQLWARLRAAPDTPAGPRRP